MDQHQQPEKDVGAHDNALHEPTLLDLRGTFAYSEHQAPSFMGRSPRNRNRHVVLVHEDYLVLHTHDAVSLSHLPTQTMLWKIVCPSFNFAFDAPHNLLVLAPEPHATSLVVWDLRTGEVLHQLTYEKDDLRYEVSANGLALSPDGCLLAAGMESEEAEETLIAVWSLEDGQLLWTLPMQEYIAITALAFHPDGKLLAG